MKTLNKPTLEQALMSLSRLVKTTSYYPDSHPSIKQAITACTEKLYLGIRANQEGFISIEIRRQGFIHQEMWLNPENKILTQLAQRFFSHKIKSMVIFPNLSEEHLLTLAHCLGLEPEQLEAQGGAAHILKQQQASSILINEMDLGAISSHKRNLDANRSLRHTGDPSVDHTKVSAAQNSVNIPPPEIPSGQNLDDALNAAQQLIDKRQPELLPELLVCLDKIKLHLSPAMTDAQQIPDVIQTLIRLDGWIHTAPDELSGACHRFLQSLDQDRVATLLLENSQHSSMQDTTLRLITRLDPSVCHNVWQSLVHASDHKARRFLARAMEELGPDADKVMLAYLTDTRWYVVRNALKILSSRRNPEYIQNFSSKLGHNDDRVVKEALSALAGIKHEKAIDALLGYLSTPACTLPDLTIVALGAQKSSRAVRPLCQLALRKDPLLKNKKTTIKAIEALGEIRDPEANSALLAIIKKVKVIKRKEYSELRLAAISALGKTATQSEQEALQRLASSRDKAIATCARLAIKVAEKG